MFIGELINFEQNYTINEFTVTIKTINLNYVNYNLQKIQTETE